MSINKDTRWYTTVQGDTWDMIAKKVYGDEMLLYLLMDYNPDFIHIIVFDSDYVLEVPPLSDEDIDEDDREQLWG